MKKEPLLYTMILRDKLAEILEAFQACVGLSIQVIDEAGTTLIQRGTTTSFCCAFREYIHAENMCVKQYLKSSKQSIDFGGSYIFSCHANLNHIAYPFVSKDTFLGAVLVGPFLMQEPDSLLISDIAKRHTMSIDALLDLYELSSDIPIISPSLVTQISRLLEYTFASLITDSRLQFMVRQNRLEQQSRINESIQMYKSSGETPEVSYPYEKEKALLAKIKSGNIPEAKGILNDLLGYVLFSSGSDLATVKARAMELSSLLSRTAIEGGAATDSILRINNQFLMTLSDINSMDNLCLKLQEIVETFSNSMFSTIPAKNSEVMKKAFSYISQNFSKNITLDEVAGHVHLNPAYFSTIFKQSCGSTFKEYLNMVRIEESKRLLANTNYSIINIAIATGFEDQSYFSKVFKKYTGLTPKQFR